LIGNAQELQERPLSNSKVMDAGKIAHPRFSEKQKEDVSRETFRPSEADNAPAVFDHGKHQIHSAIWSKP
jgi:hypothetical protein